jgi:hypothetical protein
MARPVTGKTEPVAHAGRFGGGGVRQLRGTAMRAAIRGLGSAALCAAGSYGNRPWPIPFLHILAVSNREDVRGEHSR